MTLNKLAVILGVAALLFLGAMPAAAQAPWSATFWIYFQDDAQSTDTTTVFFGTGESATYCIDSLNPTVREYEAPPPPPGFDVRFKNIPSRGTQTCYGQGLQRWDFINPQPLDTFQIAIANNDVTSATWTLRWGSPSYLSARCDSIKMTIPTIGTINMMSVDSTQILAPGDNGIAFVRVFIWNSKIVDEVKETKSTVPATFALRQNYPNPFNPTTTITFDVAKPSTVEIGVYNVLGQKVATLASGEMSAKSYSTTWNATDSRGGQVGSGIYFVRMVARSLDGKDENFTAVRKLLLMK